MWIEAIGVATLGFTIVFLSLVILAVNVKLMSFFSNNIKRKGGK